MPYNVLLNKVITDSHLTIKEIAERCVNEGATITAAYISAIKNDKDRTPSENVSRAIARACGVSDNLLVLEAYYDNAPDEFKRMMDTLKDSLLIGIVAMFENSVGPEMTAAMRKKLDDMPVAELVQTIANQNRDEITKLSEAFNVTSISLDGDSKATLEFRQVEGLLVPDDAMTPVIPKGSSVIPFLCDKYIDYQNGDILCYKKLDSDQISVRQVTFLNDEHTKMTMAAYNQKYGVEVLNVEDIIIIGKIAKMIIDFK